MLGTRITSFAFGFACASGISMYKLKEEIWSSHKILADQVRPPTRADPDPSNAPTVTRSDSKITSLPARILRAHRRKNAER